MKKLANEKLSSSLLSDPSFVEDQLNEKLSSANKVGSFKKKLYVKILSQSRGVTINDL